MRIWIGGVLVVLGALWLLDAADVIDAGAVVDAWWPLALVGLAGIAAVLERRLSLGPVVLFVVGTLLLVDRLGVVDVGALIWPSIAIGAGLWLLVHRGQWTRREDQVSDRQDVVALLGASQGRNRSEHFQHANVSAVFGGATLDMREAHLEPGARVDALALFGGVDVIVPPDWRVEIGGLPIFGGYEDKTRSDGNLPPDAPVLHVAATAIFGGVDVKNTPDQRT